MQAATANTKPLEAEAVTKPASAPVSRWIASEARSRRSSSGMNASAISLIACWASGTVREAPSTVIVPDALITWRRFQREKWMNSSWLYYRLRKVMSWAAPGHRIDVALPLYVHPAHSGLILKSFPSGRSWPPSTTMVVPVIYAASSEARKRKALATSSGVPSRPSGIDSAICRMNVSLR